MHKPNMLFADALRAQRLTLKALSERTGVSVCQLSEFKNGYRRPVPVNAWRIAEALGTTPEALDLVRPSRRAQVGNAAAAGEAAGKAVTA